MPKKKNNMILLLVLAIAAVAVLALLTIPYGSHLKVVASVTANAISIQSCSLEKNYPINMLGDMRNTVSLGVNSISMQVYYGQSLVLSSQKGNLGIGNCVIDSNIVPSSVPSNSNLLVVVKLIDPSGNIIAQNQETILY